MKKISLVESNNVIGGCCKVCNSVYENVTMGGVTSCKLVTTCTDKHGSTTIMHDADSSLCGEIPSHKH